ncbi:unnamed protein product [Alternaria alternata]
MDMDDEENDEIAAAMGFASFGGTKKRKFDHSPKAKPDANDASGANSTALGVRTKKVASAEDVKNAGLASFLARGQNLPEHPPPTATTQAPAASADQSAGEMVSFGGPSVSRAELNMLRNGVRTENGDTVYFLPSFVEDPWARLRKGGVDE